MRKLVLLFIAALAFGQVEAQQWGLYTLYAVKGSNTAYLIDTSNTVYHSWSFSSSKSTVYSTYLDQDKNLWRSYKPSANTWNTGPCHGGIQKVAWDGTVLWDFTYYANGDYTAHHDICPLPNGNVLLICYDYRSSTEATQAGSSSASTFYSEKIVEMQQTGPTTYSIVWEWYLWDHLCQSYNSAKDNYVSNTADHPELMNINYAGSGMLPDRYHMNGLDYNEELDQIVFSMHFMNQAFVIDHSTTTAEAAGHSGGNSGKGGDFLYRWGNPASYGATGTTQFATIHDAHWVSSDNPNYPDYLAGFNNEGGTSGKSAVTIWQPPYNGYNYSMTAGTQTPANEAYQYNSSFTTTNEGNSQQLPNGNMIVNNSFGRTIYEINSSGSTVWSYTYGTGGQGSSHAYRFSKCEVRGPVASITADTDICEGDALSLTAVGTSVTETSPSYTYAWASNPAGFTSSNASETLYPTVQTTYTVTITNASLGCWDTASVTVSIHPQPATPVITDQGSYLSSSSASAYQWYLDGNLIAGATSQNYTPLTTGDYTVMITDEWGCTATSAPVNFIATALTEDDAYLINVYPNPGNGQLYLSGSWIDAGNFTMTVFNPFGQMIGMFSNERHPDLSMLPEGVYQLRFQNAQQTLTRTCIIQK